MLRVWWYALLILAAPSLVWAGCWESLVSDRFESGVLVYALDSDSFFSPEELKIARGFYDRMHQLGTGYYREYNGIMVDNPVDASQNFSFQEDGFVLKSEITSRVKTRLNAEEEKLIRKTHDRVLRTLFDRLSAYSVDTKYFQKYDSYEVQSFGVRYFLRPGVMIQPVPFHHDDCRYQALIVLRKSYSLTGAENIFVEMDSYRDQRSKLERPQKERDRVVRRIKRGAEGGKNALEIATPRNRLLLFDGTNTMHGVEAFDTLSSRGGPDRERDLWGICIK